MKRLLPVVLFLILGACAAPVSIASAATAETVWLCRPGIANDPCMPGLSTTVFAPSGKLLTVLHPKPVRHPAIDCFYVYPTVSEEKTGNANLQIDPEERSIALYQTARYSQYCRVFAPMYRQLTLAAIGIGKPTTPPSLALALGDVRSAFQDYLAHYNDGRGFVLIGHSQGSMLLRSLIKLDIDGKPAIRKRLVSAIIPGGNVLVKAGSVLGGDFQHIPGCHSTRQLGCVVGYSTFNQPVPSGSLFGYPNGILGPAAQPGDAVLCANPTSLGGGSGAAELIVPSQPFASGTLIGAGTAAVGLVVPKAHTVWVSMPARYRARCTPSNGANVLELTSINGAKVLTPIPSAVWGLHLLDANIALGNLVTMVGQQATEWTKRHPQAGANGRSRGMAKPAPRTGLG